MNNAATATQTDTYRLRYTHTGGYYRLHIIGDVAGKVAGIKFPTSPGMADLRGFLARKGFEAYGDMACMSDGTHVSMVRPVA